MAHREVMNREHRTAGAAEPKNELAGGALIDVAQTLLGHPYVRTTQGYACTQMEQVEHHYRRVLP